MAIDLCLERQVAGMVTAPINKEAMNLAGYRYAGHTELLAERTGKKEAAMMLVTPLALRREARVWLCSAHEASRPLPKGG